MIGKAIGAALGGTVANKASKDPLTGIIVGTATMFVAKRVLPARLVGIGAALAAGYVTTKLAQRAERQLHLGETMGKAAKRGAAKAAAPARKAAGTARRVAATARRAAKAD
jgi:hypothetical protein